MTTTYACDTCRHTHGTPGDVLDEVAGFRTIRAADLQPGDTVWYYSPVWECEHAVRIVSVPERYVAPCGQAMVRVRASFMTSGGMVTLRMATDA